MKTITFTVEKGATDCPELEIIHLDHLNVDGKIYPVSINFNKYVCNAEAEIVYEAGQMVLKAKAELPDEYLDLYPSVQALMYHDLIHEEQQLISIGLCSAPNTDHSIKTIREQIKELNCDGVEIPM